MFDHRGRVGRWAPAWRYRRMGGGTEESPGSITWNNLVNLSADARIARMFVERSIKSRVRALLEEFPAVAILGPRQSGKTTLALDLISPSDTYLDLELPSDRAKLADPESFFASRPEGLVVLDEIHRVPELFAVMRGVIDRRRVDGRRGGQFLLLGSADRDLLKQSSESLAGRLATVELTPLLVEEVPDADLETLWLRGGFPDSFLARSAPASFRWRQEFIATYLERDIVQFAPRVASETVRRLWTMLAYEQGQLLNAAKMAGSLGISGSTVSRYIDLLVDLLLVRRLTPWHSNQRKRLVRSPKVYVRDSGLVHSLLGLQEIDELLGNPVVGGSRNRPGDRVSRPGKVGDRDQTLKGALARPRFPRGGRRSGAGTALSGVPRCRSFSDGRSRSVGRARSSCRASGSISVNRRPGARRRSGRAGPRR